MGRKLQKTRLGVPSVRVIKHTYGMQIDTMDHFYQYFVLMGRVQQKFGMTHLFGVNRMISCSRADSFTKFNADDLSTFDYDIQE